MGQLTIGSNPTGSAFHHPSDVVIPKRARTGVRRPRRHVRKLRPKGGQILVKNLPILAKFEDVAEYFMNYGDVEKVHFKHRRDILHGLCCVVTMASMGEARQVLNQARHMIMGKEVHVQKYYGKHNHMNVYTRGRRKMTVGPLNFFGGRQAIWYLENLFAPCRRYSSIQLLRNVDDGPYRYAKTRFRTIDERQMAETRAQNVGLNVFRRGF